MNKQEIAAALAVKHGLPQKEAENFLTHLVDVLNDALRYEKQVKVKGLGTFKVTPVNARASVDVNTGERIVIEGRDKITFTPEASMRDWVNKPFAQFETVVINDGVDFDEIDAKYESTPEETGVLSTVECPPLVDIGDNESISNIDEVSNQAPTNDTPAASSAPIATVAALVEVGDDLHDEIAEEERPIDEEPQPENSDEGKEEDIDHDQNITNNLITQETMKKETSDNNLNEEASAVVEHNDDEQGTATLTVETTNANENTYDKAEEETTSAEPVESQTNEEEEEENVEALDEYGYPSSKFQINELKWRLKRSNFFVRLLSGAIVALALICGIGFYYMFREMSKKDHRIDSLVAEVLDLSHKNTEVNEENARMINVDDINLTAEQAAQLAEIRRQRRIEQQQRKKEIDDAYVKKMEDTRESVREQYRLREEQVAERMKRQQEQEKAEKEREAKELAAKEKAAKEKAAKEKAILEQLAREKAAKEKAAREQTQKAAQEKAAREQAQKAVQEKAAREQAQKAAQEKAAKAAAQKQQSAKPVPANASAYNNDPRVRTGAYIITGVAQTVTVRPGQTLTSISKAYLGAGMECYVEAINGGIKEVSAGQKIKIPTLQLKKKQ